MHANSPQELEHQLRQHWKVMMDHLASVTGGHQTFAGYPAIAIVFGSTEELHMDKSK